MIIPNGYILLYTSLTEGGIDPETGYPVEPSGTWGNRIDCQYSANNYDRLGTAGGGHFTVAQFTILVDGTPLDNAERLQLYANNGKLIGEYSIKSDEYLEAVDQTKIITD